QDGSLLVLRFEVQNLGPAPFDVGPEDLTFMTCPTADNSSCVGSWSVVDPEEMLEMFDERQSRGRAAAQNQAALDASLFFLSAATDAATIASGRGSSTTGLNTIASANNAQVNAVRAEASLTALASQRQTWANVALRRTTLPPGHGA